MDQLQRGFAGVREARINRRVANACQRCRLKKSKCDNGTPCSRCKADNAICATSQQRHSPDKKYSTQYARILEQQQVQLVAELQKLYRCMQAGSYWTGCELREVDGQPLTHDILATLGVLEDEDGSSRHEQTYDVWDRILADDTVNRPENQSQSENLSSLQLQFEARKVSPTLCPTTTSLTALDSVGVSLLQTPHDILENIADSSILKSKMAAPTQPNQPRLTNIHRCWVTECKACHQHSCKPFTRQCEGPDLFHESKEKGTVAKHHDFGMLFSNELSTPETNFDSFTSWDLA